MVAGAFYLRSTREKHPITLKSSQTSFVLSEDTYYIHIYVYMRCSLNNELDKSKFLISFRNHMLLLIQEIMDFLPHIIILMQRLIKFSRKSLNLHELWIALNFRVMILDVI